MIIYGFGQWLECEVSITNGILAMSHTLFIYFSEHHIKLIRRWQGFQLNCVTARCGTMYRLWKKHAAHYRRWQILLMIHWLPWKRSGGFLFSFISTVKLAFVQIFLKQF